MNDDHVGDDARIDDAALDACEDRLTALASGDRPRGEDAAEDLLLTLLADWRAETAAAPLPELPGDREIAEALAPNVTPLRPRRGWVPGGEHHHGVRPAMWQAVTGAAAVAAVLVGGLSVAAHNSAPGDPLWGVNKSIFAEHAGNVELVSELSDSLSRAESAARTGDRDTAERLLQEVSERLDQVGDAEKRVELIRMRDAIERDLSRVTPTSVPSPAPAPRPPMATPGPQTLVPAPPEAAAGAPTPTMPVIPVPLDGLSISTTLQIPIDTSRLQDLLSSDTDEPEQDMGAMNDPDGPDVQPTVVPTPAKTTTRPTATAAPDRVRGGN